MISLNDIDQTKMLSQPGLMEEIEKAFSSKVNVPTRLHVDIPVNNENPDSTLLIMPAWQSGEAIGIKIVTVCPGNNKRNLPSIVGNYILSDGITGIPRLIMDGALLTAWRTAAVSALASRYLSRENSRCLLMVGTGTLAPHLIRAHRQMRPIEKVLVWGRNISKAKTIVTNLRDEGINASIAECLDVAVAEADIISCATLSGEPLIYGRWLKPGVHLDMVGSFKPNLREADDEAIRITKKYADTKEGATTESGDYVIPLNQALMSKDDIVGDLYDLVDGRVNGRTSDEEMTFFNSVGTAAADFGAALHVWNQIK